MCLKAGGTAARPNLREEGPADAMTDVIGVGHDDDGEILQGSRQRHVPGEPGVWVLIFGDMLVFAVLFAVYLHARGPEHELFAASQEALNRNFGAINTLVLLTSSLLVVIAGRALRSEKWRHLAQRLTLAGAAVGVCFVVIKVI